MSDIDVNGAAKRVFESSQRQFAFLVGEICGRNASRVESNIELMLLAAFDVLSFISPGKDGLPILTVSPTDVPPSPLISTITVTPQFIWNEYRIDFRIDWKKCPYPFFIECDGHDFHERTKEQAERDRSRDRKIQEAGIPILRFTGREIYRSPSDVVDQILTFMQSRRSDGTN